MIILPPYIYEHFMVKWVRTYCHTSWHQSHGAAVKGRGFVMGLASPSSFTIICLTFIPAETLCRHNKSGSASVSPTERDRSSVTETLNVFYSLFFVANDERQQVKLKSSSTVDCGVPCCFTREHVWPVSSWSVLSSSRSRGCVSCFPLTTFGCGGGGEPSPSL